jgi:hypothetical protein
MARGIFAPLSDICYYLRRRKKPDVRVDNKVHWIFSSSVTLAGGFLNANQTAAAILNLLPKDQIRIALIGPCGVGKSEAAREISRLRPVVQVIEHDALKNQSLPCSVSTFDLFACFGPHIVATEQFVLDVGGGVVFRSGVDNKDRLQDVLRFKQQFSVKVIMLTARRDVVLERYLRFPGSFEKYFEHAWYEWIEIEGPFWEKCVDFSPLDTSE